MHGVPFPPRHNFFIRNFPSPLFSTLSFPVPSYHPLPIQISFCPLCSPLAFFSFSLINPPLFLFYFSFITPSSIDLSRFTGFPLVLSISFFRKIFFSVAPPYLLPPHKSRPPTVTKGNLLSGFGPSFAVFTPHPLPPLSNRVTSSPSRSPPLQRHPPLVFPIAHW